jgi:type I restriction enzyme, S subunit
MNFTKYKKYNDSGLEWLGELPEGWDLNHLKRYCKNITDGAHTSPNPSSNDFPFLTVVDLKNGELDFENCLFTSKEDYKLLVRNGCNPTLNDVLYSKDGTIGETVVINEDKCFVVGSSFIIIKPDTKKCVPTYLKYLLGSSVMKYQARIYVKGAGLPRISIFNLSKLLLPFPSVSLQSAIAKYLDEKTTRIGKQVELLQAKKERYEELRKTLISEVVTKGLDKTVELKDSGVEWLGKIPKHWDVIRSKNLFENVSIKNRPNETLLSIYRDYGVIEKTSRDDNHNRASDDLSNYKFVKNGYLVINKMKAWQGSVAISTLEGIVSPAYITCKPIIKEHNFYFHYLLRSASCITEFQRFSYGVRPDQWDLRYTDFADFMFTVPPLAEQIAITNYLDEKTGKIDSIIVKIEESIVFLNEFRKTLINDAVTGKIKVA